MTNNKWFISDTHFFHANTWQLFKKDDGSPLRDFKSTEEMNEHMISMWNSVVKDNDYVYHLGDVTFRYDGSFNNLMSRLRGKKRLIVGNHDKLKNPSLPNHFEKMELWKGFSAKEASIAFTASHFPLPQSLLRNGKHNVHGHIHFRDSPESHQFNVSVEVINYTPVHIDVICEHFKQEASA